MFNKEYIKRELVLNELGYELNIDVKKYIDVFNELFGNINDLDKKQINLHDAENLYLKNGDILLLSNIYESIFLVNNTKWTKFEKKFNLTYTETNNLLEVILSHLFNIEIISVSYIDNHTYNILIERYL